MILSNRTSHPLARSYVLKLDAPIDPGRIAGRLSHVATGRQFHFTSAAQLIARLVDGDAATQRQENGE
jgi:hypothetical protein